MKTTIDLPDDLFREVKLKSVREGRKLKDMVADLLRKGLDAPDGTAPPPRTERFQRDPRTGLPMIACRRSPAATDTLSPQRLADILLEQEIGWSHESGR